MAEADNAAGTTDAPDTTTVGDQATGDDQQTGLLEQSDDSQADPAEEETEELDVDGRKFALPKSVVKELNDRGLMRADYSKKTAETAEQRRANEQERVQIVQRVEQINRMEADVQAVMQEVATITAIDRQLAELAKVDYNSLVNQNPQEAMKLRYAVDELRHAKQQLEGSVQHKKQSIDSTRKQEALHKEQADAQAMRVGAAVLERDIPGWNTQKADELREYAVSKLGARPEELQGLRSPALVKALHESKLYRALLAKTTQKPKPAAQAAPVTKVTGKQSGFVTDPDKLSMEDWTKWRNAQVRRKRA